MDNSEKTRTRIETGYRKVSSASGDFSPHISKKTNERITRYCKMQNINKTKFVEECCNKRLDILEREALEAKSKEELIAMLMEG